MKARDLYWFLALQLLAIVVAGVVFSLISSRLIAGGLAGLYFVLSATWMLVRAWRWPHKWASLCIYPLMVHLFVVSLPMVIVRFLNADKPFDEVHIWGLEGPQFHALSGWVFSLLVGATVIDLLRIKIKSRQGAN